MLFPNHLCSLFLLFAVSISVFGGTEKSSFDLRDTVAWNPTMNSQCDLMSRRASWFMEPRNVWRLDFLERRMREAGVSNLLVLAEVWGRNECQFYLLSSQKVVRLKYDSTVYDKKDERKVLLASGTFLKVVDSEIEKVRNGKGWIPDSFATSTDDFFCFLTFWDKEKFRTIVFAGRPNAFEPSEEERELQREYEQCNTIFDLLRSVFDR